MEGYSELNVFHYWYMRYAPEFEGVTSDKILSLFSCFRKIETVFSFVPSLSERNQILQESVAEEYRIT